MEVLQISCQARAWVVLKGATRSFWPYPLVILEVLFRRIHSIPQTCALNSRMRARGDLKMHNLLCTCTRNCAHPSPGRKRSGFIKDGRALPPLRLFLLDDPDIRDPSEGILTILILFQVFYHIPNRIQGHGDPDQGLHFNPGPCLRLDQA